jgi:hypothetical protein
MWPLLLPLWLCACASKPLTPWSADGPPLIMAPAAAAGITDKRGRFREISCAVLEDHGENAANFRPCAEALTRVGEESGATGEAVNLKPSERKLIAAMVPGLGWECFRAWLRYDNEFKELSDEFGYGTYIFEVDGLSGIETNARQIRDTIIEHADRIEPHSLVLIGYSKGAPDILQALVSYPEIHPYIAAVASVSGSVGGSPLANQVTQDDANLLRHIPDSECTAGDGKAIEDLRPSVRQAWLAENPLPDSIPYYSLVTYPEPDQISSILKSSWRKLSKVDSRNDSQVIFYDQLIPGSTLVAYLNADHWAIAVPIAETHPFIGRHFVDKNSYPRRAMAEALMRFIEEDLDRR